jgi:hypothetical protein
LGIRPRGRLARPGSRARSGRLCFRLAQEYVSLSLTDDAISAPSPAVQGVPYTDERSRLRQKRLPGNRVSLR